MAKKPGDETREFVASLDRGLRVLRVFSREHPQLTLSEVAGLTSLSPATARRSLQTLEALGYVGRNGRQFLLRPKVLALSSGYLSAINTSVVFEPFLQEVVDEVGGSASVTVLDDLDVVYIARVSAGRAVRPTAGVGSRYPAYATAVGRVLLAYQPTWAIDAYFNQARLVAFTDATEIRPAALRDVLKSVRVAGYAAIRDELDYGIVSVAIPIFGREGRPVAAANCTDVTNRLDVGTLVARRLPTLRQAVLRIENMLALHPEIEGSLESVTSDHMRGSLAARHRNDLRAGKTAGLEP